MKKESLKFALGVIIIAFIFVDLALLNIDAPFNHVTGDSDALYGLAAKNLAQKGVWKMEFGMYDSVYRDGDVLRGNFYTDHPDGFIFPTVILYKMFGISEATTRLGPILEMLLALFLFAYALRKIFNNDVKAWLVALILAILPGFVFYGETLEIAVPALALALICFSLFVLYYPDGGRLKLFLFYLSIFIGCLCGWFFYFMPAAIWLYLLFSKKAGKIKLLIFIPLIILAATALDLAQFFWLNGNVLGDLLSAADSRAGAVSWDAWWSKIFSMLLLHSTFVFLELSGAGLIIFFAGLKKNAAWRIFLPLLLFPLFICLCFREWVTHPFGVIYFLPIIAAFSGLVIFSLFDFLTGRFGERGKAAALVLISAIILGGAYFSYQNINIFFEKFIMLDNQDIELLKYLSQMDYLHDNDICLGADNFHIPYVKIAEWYLGKKVACAEEKNKVVLVFNPDLDKKIGGDFYSCAYQEFIRQGYGVTGCSGFLCLMVNSSFQGLPPLQNLP
jgi:4-amino-4-deoxy-L-arabinose transferase-like glycosyltransferase